MSFSCENFSPLHGLCSLFLELLLLGCWISWTHPLVSFSLFSTLLFTLLSRSSLNILSTPFFEFFISDMFPTSRDYLCFQALPSCSFTEGMFSLRILMSGFLLNCTTCFSQVAFLFILNILMLNAVLTRLLVRSCLKSKWKKD